MPANEATGAENLSLQGVVLIGLFAAIGAAGWRGLGQVDVAAGRLTTLTLALVVATLAFAALGLRAGGEGLAVTVTGRTLAVLLLCLALRRRRAASNPGTCSSGCGKPGAS